MTNLTLLRFILATLLVVSGRAANPMETLPGSRLVSNQYIISLNPDTDISQHLMAIGLDPSSNPHLIGHQLDRLHLKPTLLHVYRKALHGYAVRCNESFLAIIRSRGGEILAVESDQFLTISTVITSSSDSSITSSDEFNTKAADQLNPPSWGLDRIDQHLLPLDNHYRFPDSAGYGVDIYSIDTGVDVTHKDFEGRAMWGITIPSGEGDFDGNGHGTHTAGTAASHSYGVAKKATIIAVKVFNSGGFGTTSDIVAGIDWTIQSHIQRASRGSVVLMGLGGSKSTTIDVAVKNAYNAGLVVVTAGGSSSSNACNYSPAGVPEAITCIASDANDALASSANIGPCIDMIAPGISIVSTWPGNNNRTLSGGAMAAAHVAGAAAVLLGEQSLTPSEVTQKLEQSATANVISRVPDDTKNLLVYVDSTWRR